MKGRYFHAVEVIYTGFFRKKKVSRQFLFCFLPNTGCVAGDGAGAADVETGLGASARLSSVVAFGLIYYEQNFLTSELSRKGSQLGGSEAEPGNPGVGLGRAGLQVSDHGSLDYVLLVSRSF